ncbi:MAG: enolase C-terminal domain-like protein [Patescibacteria group bacterium]|nr:enolase C-terminal domain-like protein [Patescibacteria group bacterium]
MAQSTRRTFLARAAGLAGSGLAGSGLAGSGLLHSLAEARTMSELKIARIETIPVNYATRGRFKFFEGPRGEPLGRQTVVVKITAEDGTVGWGQSVPSHKWSYETAETVRTTIDGYLAPALIGRNALDVDAIHAVMNAVIAPMFSTGQPICKAGIDLALFDLAGKHLGQTAAEYWGRKGRRRITVSWTLNPVSLDDIPRLIDEGWRQGYRNFNVKVAPDPEFDVAMCRIVKRLVPDGFLWADANGGYDEATALAVAPRLAEVGVAVLEQPLRPNRITGYQKLKKQGALPIILDESLVNSSDLEEFIRLDMLDGVAMKPARCAGLTDARRQIEMALDHGLMFLGSGLTDPDVSLAASLLLYGAYDLRYPAALNGPQFLTGSFLKQPFEVIDGYLTLPAGAGLGVEVDEDLLDQMRSRG